MNEHLKSLSESIFTATKAYFDKGVASFRTAIFEIDGRVKTLESLPPAKDGKDGEAGRDGKDGKDLDPVQVVELLSESVKSIAASLPIPKDGKDGNHGKDGASLDEITPVLEVIVEKRVAGLPLLKGDPGRDGADADPELIKALVAEEVKASAESWPKAEKGEPGPKGEDGKSVTLADLEPVVAKYVKELPAAEKGERGEKGDPGDSIKGEKGDPGESIKGDPGKDADQDAILAAVVERVDTEAIEKAVLVKVSKVLDDIPAPKDGRDGKDADPDLIWTAVRVEVGKALDEIPKPDTAAIKQAVIGQVLEQLPRPQDGKDGKDVDVEQVLDRVRSLLDDLVQKAVDAKVTEILAQIPKPIDGAPGDAGRDGADGKDGQDGRDALQIEVHNSIDVERSYPRNTYAHHAGGIVRSFKSTLPGEVNEEHGWMAAFDGLAEVEVEQGSDERSFGFALRRTSGALTLKTFTPPIPIWREYFKDGREYDRGDMATYDGILWHAVRKTAQIPGQGPDWRIAAKRGHDGRDGKDGQKGDKGERGERGERVEHFK